MSIFDGIRGVLFDMDGTLVDTNIDFSTMKREIVRFAEEKGVSADEVKALDILAVVDFVAERFSDRGALRREAFKRLEEFEMEPCRNARPVPHALELIDALRAIDMKVGIVTRNCRSGVLISSEVTGVNGDVLLTRDDVPNTKPHPEHLLRALACLEVRPHEAVMVGDHWMDVQAGKAAGTRTVGFLREGRPDDFFADSQPDLVIRDLRELLDRLERLNK
ncbi:MAG: HAD family hydrolase [Armatimonadota bacterium]